MRLPEPQLHVKGLARRESITPPCLEIDLSVVVSESLQCLVGVLQVRQAPRPLAPPIPPPVSGSHWLVSSCSVALVQSVQGGEGAS